MKKIAFIGHSYHKKTKSFDFWFSYKFNLLFRSWTTEGMLFSPSGRKLRAGISGLILNSNPLNANIFCFPSKCVIINPSLATVIMEKFNDFLTLGCINFWQRHFSLDLIFKWTAYLCLISLISKITAKRRNSTHICIFRALGVFCGSTLTLILSKYQRRPLQHIYMYRCKNNTIRFIILIFKALNLRAPDKRCKHVKYKVL